MLAYYLQLIKGLKMNTPIRMISLLWALGYIGNAHANPMEDYLQAHQLLEPYRQRVNFIESNDYIKDKLPQFDTSIAATINSPLNDNYKQAYLKDLINQFPYNAFAAGTEFSPLYGVRFDPLGSIKYLESLDNRTWVDNFQLMVLLQAYQPEKISTDLYKNMARTNHEEMQSYFASGKWQSSWHQDEYSAAIGSDYQACYADVKCLLSIVPYWRNCDEDVSVVIPCQLAQQYDKVAYMDGAGGGHGAQSFMTSDCELYDKYDYNENLTAYTSKLFHEGMPDSSGSNRFYHQAKSVYNSLISQYSPKFDLAPQPRWDAFPYTEWAVQSYYNFNKYNDVLNYGIGYQQALNEMTKHYMTNFGATKEQAYNTALSTLKIPSMDDWELISPDNLYYMLLSGQPWSSIEQKHEDIKDYSKLLEFSIAYPNNLQEIIRKGKVADKHFDIDSPNWFGKTPLMLAAQYGYLDSVKLLQANGADINKQTSAEECWDSNTSFCINHGKRTALMYAAQEGQFDVILYLIEQGADISLQDTKGLSAYDYMLGTSLKYNPHVRPTINGGSAVYWDEKDRKSAFSAEQIQQLTPLLKPQN